MARSTNKVHVHIGTGHKTAESCKRDLSADGRYLLTGSFDCSVRLWHALTGKELQLLRGHTEPITCVAFLNSGLFALSGSDDLALRLWDLSTGAGSIVSTASTDQRPEAIAISRDDELCVVARGNGCSIVDLHAAEEVAFIASDVLPNAVALSPDKRFLAIGGATGAELIDLDTRQRQQLAGFFCRNVRFDKRGMKLLVAGDGRCFIHDLATNQSGEPGPYEAGDWVFHKNYFVPEKDAGLEELGWHYASTRPLQTVFTSLLDQLNGDVALTREDAPDARSSAYRLRHLRTGRISGPGIQPDPFVRVVAMNGTGSRVLLLDDTPDPGSGEQTPALGIVRFDEPENIRWLDRNYDEHCTGAISPDDSLAVTAGNNELHVWDLQSGSLPRIIRGQESRITALAIGPDNRQLLTGSQKNSLVLWDLHTGNMTRILEGHSARVIAVAIGADDLGLSVSEDQRMILWDLKTGTPKKEYRLDDRIDRIAFSSDNAYCLFGCTHTRSAWANSVCFLNLHTGKVDAILPLWSTWDDCLLYNEDSYFAGTKRTMTRMVSFLDGLTFAGPGEKGELSAEFHDNKTFDFLRELGYRLPMDDDRESEDLPF